MAPAPWRKSARRWRATATPLVSDLHLLRVGLNEFAVVAAVVTDEPRTPEDYKARIPPARRTGARDHRSKPMSRARAIRPARRCKQLVSSMSFSLPASPPGTTIPRSHRPLSRFSRSPPATAPKPTSSAATARASSTSATARNPPTLIPTSSPAPREFNLVEALFEGLAGVDPVDLHPVPAAARSWDISPDGRVYTFHLRPEGPVEQRRPRHGPGFCLQHPARPHARARRGSSRSTSGSSRTPAPSTRASSPTSRRSASGSSIPLTLEITLENPTALLP